MSGPCLVDGDGFHIGDDVPHAVQERAVREVQA